MTAPAPRPLPMYLRGRFVLRTVRRGSWPRHL